MEVKSMISNMLRFNPTLFESLNDIFAQDFPVFAERVQMQTFPQVNMGVTDKSVEVYLFAPGVDAANLDISLEKNLLSISGERKVEEAGDDKDVMSRRERLFGRFKRTITLPDDVDIDKTEATYRNGVLHISIAKREESQPRQIKVAA